ncbi:MAG: hypothetical protein ACO243_04580, partial [Candidatus Nanopelagicaceae bacterium]
VGSQIEFARANSTFALPQHSIYSQQIKLALVRKSNLLAQIQHLLYPNASFIWRVSFEDAME